MIEKLKKLPLLQMGMLTFLVLNVSISFTTFHFLQLLSYLVLGVCMLSFAILSVMSLRKPIINYLDACTIIYLILLIGFTVMNGTDIKLAIYRSIEVGLLIMILNYWEKPEVMVKTFAFVLSCCVYANLLIMIIFPDWMFAAKDTFDSYLLGGNYNQIGGRLIFALVLSLLCTIFHKLWMVNFVIMAIVSVVTLAMVGSMTSLSCILLFLVFCMIPSEKLQKACCISFFLFYLMFQTVVVFSGEGLHNNEMAVYIIEDVLGKDVTFTHRTQLWDAAGRKFAESPFIGYGFVDSEWFLSEMDSFAIGPHNFIYNVLLNGGLTLISLFLLMLVIILRRIRLRYDKMGNMLLLGLCTMFFMMTMEVFPFFFVFCLFYVVYYYPTMKFNIPCAKKQ